MQGEDLSGRVAIVTGAGRGLGRAMALGLVRAGALVVATASREPRQLDEVRQEAERVCGPNRLVSLASDVARDADCARVASVAIERFGKIDILVNNAARGMINVSPTFMTEPTRFWEVEPATWRMMIDTNVNGPFLMARSVAPSMIKAGWGRIINISMNHETMRRDGFSPYGPSKAALESETIIWSQELARHGVTVNALVPGGATLTGMIPDSTPQEARAKLLDPEIIVAPLLWLCSADSDQMTGRRLIATRWRPDLPGRDAAEAAAEESGWGFARPTGN